MPAFLLKPVNVAFLYAALMIPLGIVAYVATGANSMTALFGSFAGGLVLIAAFVATRGEKARMHAMHAVALLLLVTAGGSLSRLVPALGDLSAKGTVALFLGLNALLSLAALVVMVKSFIDARRARKAGQGTGGPADGAA